MQIKACLPCCLSKLEVVDARCPDRSLEGAQPSKVGQSRLRRVEESPFIEQADAVAPCFHFLAVPDPPAEMSAEPGAGSLAVGHPHVERRTGVKDQLRAWETVTQPQHQRLDLRACEVDQNNFGQKQKGALAMGAERAPPAPLPVLG